MGCTGHDLRGVEEVDPLERLLRSVGEDGGAPGGHHPLRNPFVVEVHDLLAQMVVLEQDRAARSGRQGVVGVVRPRPLCGRQVRAALRHARLVRPGGLAGRTHGLRSGLVRLRGQRLRRLRGLGHGRRHRRRLPRQAVARRFRVHVGVLGGHRLSSSALRSPGAPHRRRSRHLHAAPTRCSATDPPGTPGCTGADRAGDVLPARPSGPHRGACPVEPGRTGRARRARRPMCKARDSG